MKPSVSQSIDGATNRSFYPEKSFLVKSEITVVPCKTLNETEKQNHLYDLSKTSDSTSRNTNGREKLEEDMKSMNRKISITEKLTTDSSPHSHFCIRIDYWKGHDASALVNYGEKSPQQCASFKKSGRDFPTPAKLKERLFVMEKMWSCLKNVPLRSGGEESVFDVSSRGNIAANSLTHGNVPPCRSGSRFFSLFSQNLSKLLVLTLCFSLLSSPTCEASFVDRKGSILKNVHVDRSFNLKETDVKAVKVCYLVVETTFHSFDIAVNIFTLNHVSSFIFRKSLVMELQLTFISLIQGIKSKVMSSIPSGNYSHWMESLRNPSLRCHPPLFMKTQRLVSI